MGGEDHRRHEGGVDRKGRRRGGVRPPLHRDAHPVEPRALDRVEDPGRVHLGETGPLSQGGFKWVGRQSEYAI